MSSPMKHPYNLILALALLVMSIACFVVLALEK
jgi:hypothetical protein